MYRPWSPNANDDDDKVTVQAPAALQAPVRRFKPPPTSRPVVVMPKRKKRKVEAQVQAQVEAQVQAQVEAPVVQEPLQIPDTIVTIPAEARPPPDNVVAAEVRQRRFKPPPKNWKKPANLGKRRAPRSKAAALAAANFEMRTMEMPAFEPPPPPPPKKLDSADLIIGRQAPQTLDAVLQDAAVLNKMRDWMAKFEKRKPRDLPRCLLLVGPTGTGKSSAARLLLKEFNYMCYEYSASDYVDTTNQYTVLSEKGMDEIIYKMLCRNQAFGKFGLILDGIGRALSKDNQRHLVDILSGARYAKQFHGSGPTAKKCIWQAPVVIICDSADLAHFSTVARICQVVEFCRPPTAVLANYFQAVCDRETIEIDPVTRAKVVEGCGGDVRRMLNTLHFLALGPLGQNGTSNETVIDVTTVFYDEQNPLGLMRAALARHRAGDSLEKLDDLLSLHPLSLAMLMQENYTSGIDGSGGETTIAYTIEAAANVAEYLSEIEVLGHQLYHEPHHSELDEVHCALATWGVMVKTPNMGAGLALGTLNKSAYFGWKEKTKYRRKLMAAFPTISERGESFIDTATVVSAMVEKHCKSKKPVDESTLKYFEGQKWTYKDVQDLWKIAHVKDETMPIVRGKNSLRQSMK